MMSIGNRLARQDDSEQSKRFIDLARAVEAGIDKSGPVLKELAKPGLSNAGQFK
jgi:hypothetical protein